MPGALALLVGALAYDVWAIRRRRETISAGVRRARRWPLGHTVTLGGWLYLTHHLFTDPRRTVKK